MRAVENFVLEERRGEFVLSTDRSRLDLPMIHKFLTNSYWAEGIPRETVGRSLANSLCFGVYQGVKQVGFARVITDYATYAYVGDVFVLDSHRKKGLSKWMMQAMVNHPQLQALRRWTLATRDAHGLYAQVGFTPLAAPERWMERHDAKVYQRNGLSDL
jgi:GNAT superfamily N-acetyltransferase